MEYDWENRAKERETKHRALEAKKIRDDIKNGVVTYELYPTAPNGQPNLPAPNGQLNLPAPNMQPSLPAPNLPAPNVWGTLPNLPAPDVPSSDIYIRPMEPNVNSGPSDPFSKK